MRDYDITPGRNNSIEILADDSVKWSVLAEVLTRVATPIANIVLARLLVPQAFGTVATITMVLSLAEVIADAGFPKYIIQHDFCDEKELYNNANVAFWSCLWMAAFISIFIFAFRDTIAIMVGDETLGAPIAIAGLTIIFNSASSVHISFLKRNFEFKKLFIIRVVVSAIPLIITVPIAVIIRSYWAIIIGNIAKAVLQAIICIVFSKIRIRLFYSLIVLKEMFSFSFWTLVESIVIWATTNIDVFIIGRILDEYYLGLYRTAITTITTYVGIIAASITTVLFATLSRYQKEPERFMYTYFKFQRRLAIILIPCGVGVFVFRKLVTFILLGQNWMDVSDFLGIYALLYVFVVETCYFLSEIFRSKGQPKLSVLYQLAYIMIQTPLIYMAALSGFKEVCVVRCILCVIFITIALLFGRTLYGIKVLDVIKNIYVQTLGAIIMGVVGMLLLHVTNRIFFQFVYIVICIIVYFSVLLCFKSIREDVFRMLDKKRILKGNQRRGNS